MRIHSLKGQLDIMKKRYGNIYHDKLVGTYINTEFIPLGFGTHGVAAIVVQ